MQKQKFTKLNSIRFTYLNDWRRNIYVGIFCLLTNVFVGCGKSEKSIVDSSNSQTINSKILEAGMPMQAKKLGCNNCHDIEKTAIGPSWLRVSERYRGVLKYKYQGKEYLLEEGLIKSISHGGGGNWGPNPMPAMDPNVTHQSEIRELVIFVLNLGKYPNQKKE